MAKLLLFALVAFAGAFAFQSRHRCETEWRGFIGPDMVAQVKYDLQAAQTCSTLRVSLVSPGGSVFDTLEIVHLIQQSKESGLVVEIRGHTLVASGATFLLGAGSPGHRMVREGTIVLVHGIQVGWYGCYEYKPNPQTEDHKLLNVIYERMVVEYSRLSGKPIKETWGWLECGNAQAGDGQVLVNLGLADRIGG